MNKDNILLRILEVIRNQDALSSWEQAGMLRKICEILEEELDNAEEIG